MILFSASALQATDQDSTSLQKEPEVIIYVSPGVQVFGVSTIANAKVIEIAKADIPKKSIELQKKRDVIAEQVKEKKDKEERQLQKLQDIINRKNKETYYSSANYYDIVNFGRNNFCNAATVNHFNNFNFSKVLIFDKSQLTLFKSLRQKKNFYSSLSYLQFSKLRNSFLRGPTQLS